MGANSFFIDILLFGELMRPLSVSYVPVCCILESKGVQEPVAPRVKPPWGSHRQTGFWSQSGLAQRAYGMSPKAAFKTSIARQGDTTTLSGFAAVKLKNLKNLKNPRLQRSRPPLLFQTFNHP